MILFPSGKAYRSRFSNFGLRTNLKSVLLNVAVLLFICLALIADCCASTPVNVLLINAYHPGYRWSDRLVTGIRQTLTAAAPQTQLFCRAFGQQTHLFTGRF
jgi:hypothetical protein